MTETAASTELTKSTALTASLENYLEAILTISEEQQDIRAVEISKKLSVSKASVTEALRTLKNRGLLNYEPYGNISLTSHGEETAKKIAQKHAVLYDFFTNILGVESQEAVDTACKIEHIISQDVLDRFITFLESNKNKSDSK